MAGNNGVIMATNTVTKPTTIPRWGDTTSNIAEPTSGEKDAGWVAGGVHSSSYENWLAKSRGDWIKWLNERLIDGSDLDILRINYSLYIDADGASDTNKKALTVHGKGSSNAAEFYGDVISGGGGGRGLYVKGGNASTTGDGSDGGSIQGGDGAGTSGDGGDALLVAGGDCGEAGGDGVGGTGIIVFGGNSASGTTGGTAITANGGQAYTSGNCGIAIHAKSTENDGNYAIKAEGKLAAPKYSAIKIVPQNADPTSGSEGDIITTSSSHTDGAGHMKKYHGGEFRHVGVQAWATITVTAGVGVTLTKNIGVSSINLQTGNTEIRVNLDESFSDANYAVTGSNLQGQPFFVTAESQQINYCDISLYSLTTSAKIDMSSTSTKFSVFFCGD